MKIVLSTAEEGLCFEIHLLSYLTRLKFSEPFQH